MKTVALTGGAKVQFEKMYRDSIIARIEANRKISHDVGKLPPPMEWRPPIRGAPS